MKTECLVCTAPLAGVWLCGRDAAQLEAGLRRLPDLARDLEIAAARQSQFAKGVGSSGKGGPPPGIVDFDAADTLERVRRHLNGWAFYAWKHRRQAAPGSFSIPELAGFLTGQLPTMLGTQPVGALHEETMHLIRHCLKVIDLPQSREGWTYLGPCGMKFDNGTCPHQLWVRDGAQDIACPRCGTGWDVADRQGNALVAAQDLQATAPVISRALTSQGYTLTAELIATWRARGRIRPTGTNKANQPLYRVGDVMEILLKAPAKKEARQ